MLNFLLSSVLSVLSFPQVLKCEVELMAKMAKTIDGFTQNQTRLVVITDGLDACEQDRVLHMLDTVRPGRPGACRCRLGGAQRKGCMSISSGI